MYMQYALADSLRAYIYSVSKDSSYKINWI